MPIISTTRMMPNSIEADSSRGGWLCTGALANAQSYAELGRRVELWLRAEGGGVFEEDMRLALRGSMLPQSVRFDYRQSATQINIATTDYFLGLAGLQGIYFSRQVAPANPHQIANMTLGHIVKHIVEQHCNISSTAFVQNPNGTYSANPVGGWVDTSGIDTVNSTDVDVYTVPQSASMWSSLQDIASNEFYVVYFNKKDQLFYESHPMFAAVLPEPTISLDNTMIAGQPEIHYRNDMRTDQVDLYALTDDGDILRSKYPGEIGTEGRILPYTNLRCNDQPRLDQLSQRAYYYANRQLTFNVDLAGPWGVFLELYDRVAATYTGTFRNGVSVVWSDKMFWIERIRMQLMGVHNVMTSLELVEENFEEGSTYGYTYP